VELLAANEDGLDSFKEFILNLIERAQSNAMHPDCTEPEWRACQAYYKWCLEVDVFVSNFLTNRNGQAKEDKDALVH
jgi:hypothetical protein